MSATLRLLNCSGLNVMRAQSAAVIYFSSFLVSNSVMSESGTKPALLNPRGGSNQRLNAAALRCSICRGHFEFCVIAQIAGGLNHPFQKVRSPIAGRGQVCMA